MRSDRGGRMSRPRKREAVLRLLRGEDLETVSRSLGVTAAALTAWRDALLAAGEAAARRRRGRAGRMPDADLLEAIRAVLAASPFHGEGHRKVWARLRHGGVRPRQVGVERVGVGVTSGGGGGTGRRDVLSRGDG